MKKSKILIASSLLVLITFVFFMSTLYFPINENDLEENTLKSASKLFNQKISSYVVCNTTVSNNNISRIYQFVLENGDKRYYADSYYKNLLFPRYRLVSSADYSSPGFNGILIATGLPYEIVYDISKYTFEIIDSALNYTLIKIITGFVLAAFVMIVLLCRRIYTIKNP